MMPPFLRLLFKKLFVPIRKQENVDMYLKAFYSTSFLIKIKVFLVYILGIKTIKIQLRN